MLPIDDGDGDSHRLIDKNISEGESVSLAIAPLICDVAQKGVIMNVASELLQQWSRFESYNHDSIYLTEPDRFVVPIVFLKRSKFAGQKATTNKYQSQ